VAKSTDSVLGGNFKRIVSTYEIVVVHYHPLPGMVCLKLLALALKRRHFAI